MEHIHFLDKSFQPRNIFLCKTFFHGWLSGMGRSADIVTWAADKCQTALFSRRPCMSVAWYIRRVRMNIIGDYIGRMDSLAIAHIKLHMPWEIFFFVIPGSAWACWFSQNIQCYFAQFLFGRLVFFSVGALNFSCRHLCDIPSGNASICAHETAFGNCKNWVEVMAGGFFAARALWKEFGVACAMQSIYNRTRQITQARTRTQTHGRAKKKTGILSRQVHIHDIVERNRTTQHTKNSCMQKCSHGNGSWRVHFYFSDHLTSIKCAIRCRCRYKCPPSIRAISCGGETWDGLGVRRWRKLPFEQAPNPI